MGKPLRAADGSADLSEELALRKITSLRHQIVDTLLGDGLPDDPEDRKALFENMDKIERTTLTKMRISADKDISADQAQTKNLVLNILSALNRSVPGAIDESVTASVVAPTLGSEFTAPTLVPGETDIAVDNTNYDSFIERVTGQKPT